MNVVLIFFFSQKDSECAHFPKCLIVSLNVSLQFSHLHLNSLRVIFIYATFINTAYDFHMFYHCVSGVDQTSVGFSSNSTALLSASTDYFESLRESQRGILSPASKMSLMWPTLSGITSFSSDVPACWVQ